MLHGAGIFINICPNKITQFCRVFIYQHHGSHMAINFVFFMGSSNSGGDETFQKGLQLQRLRNALIDQPGHISCRHDEGFCEECRKMTLAVEEMAHVIHTFLHMFPAIRLF